MIRFLAGKLRKGGLRAHLARLHRDEQGAEGVELLLIIAAIALPLLGILIYFRGALKEWVERKWADIAGRSAEGDTDLGPPDL